ncbi:MAG: polysaccharide deacetylase family protein [Flavobacteriaceae bacterium]
MKKYLVKTPGILKALYPKRLWSLSKEKKTIYLTFDDGPIPIITPWVLETLKNFNAKATFFCIGKNVLENPEIFRQILRDGHTVGNHTQNHLNAQNIKTDIYIDNVLKAQKALAKTAEKEYSAIIQKQALFRPPYGKLSSSKAKKLQKKGYKIVMWDVLSGDFDKTISKEKCLENVLKNTNNGSIIIFHDSIKAEKNLRYALPKVLAHFSEKGFVFKAIS